MRKFIIILMLTMLMTTTAFAATIRVTGYGMGPQNVSMKNSFYKTHARQAARLDALRQISEAVNGIQVETENDIEDMVVMKDKIHAKMISNFKGAKQVGKAIFFEDGRCAVVMEYQLPQMSEDNQFIEVTGYGGGSPGAKNEGIYKMQAMKAARLDAIRLIFEEIQGVQISADTSVADLKGHIKARGSATIKSIQQIGEPKFFEDGLCEIKMRCFIFNKNISEVVLPTPKDNEIEPFPQPTKKVKLSAKYIGLIVDCRGLGLKPVMSPAILNNNGQKIYGYKYLKYDVITEKGMVSYSTDMNKVERAGKNPLMVKALSVNNANANPVVSVEDADKILTANQVTHFLDNCAVVFIR